MENEDVGGKWESGVLHYTDTKIIYSKSEHLCKGLCGYAD